MKRNATGILAFLLSITVILSAMVFPMTASAERYDENASFMSGKYGIFLHYLSGKNGQTYEEWNSSVNSFDVNGFAKTVYEIGASWVYLTLTQHDGRYCIPMPELEEMTGLDNLGTDRDLVADLYPALARYGIRLMLYWIPGAPSGNSEMASALGAQNRAGENQGGDWLLNDAQVDNMSEIMTAVSARYGEKISGWWIDGCYDSVNFTAEYAAKEAAALRAGNPNAVVAFNNGTQDGDCRFSVESYTAGETCHYLRLSQGDVFTNYSAEGRYSANGYQKHFLTFLGDNWGKSNCYYDTDTLVAHCYDNILSKGAAITFDVGVSNAGAISTDQVNQIAALNLYMRNTLDLSLDFEDGYNPYIWTDNVGNENGQYAFTSTTDLSVLATGEDALNGSYSLKVTPYAGNLTRTDIVSGTGKEKMSIKFNGDPLFSKTDFSACTGIMMRLKLKDDTSDAAHRIKLNVWQEGIEKPTRLAYGAVAYDLAGNNLNISSGSDFATLPAGFDGFIFFPFESARSEAVTVAGKYDSYNDQPQSLVDFSKEFKLTIILNDATWSGQTVLIDDIHYYAGADQSVHCDMLRALGYSSVVYKTQPAVYSFPIDFEDCQTPLTSLKFTATRITVGEDGTQKKDWPSIDSLAVLTNAADQVLDGKLSYVITNGVFPEDTQTVQYTPGNVQTNYFDVAGAAALATSAVTVSDYAYLKMRLKAPVTADGSSLIIIVGVKQGNTVYGYLGHGAKGYDNAGKLVSEVKAANHGGDGGGFSVPSGFDGNVYLPIYNLRKGWKTVYDPSSNLSMPDLSQNFKLNFELNGKNWEGAQLIMDNIDITFGSQNLPMSFEEPTDLTFTSLNHIYANAAHPNDTASISAVTGQEALNGNGSLRFTIPAENNNSRTETNYVNVPGNADYMADDLTSVTGIWLRMKVNEPEGYSGANHYFSLSMLQDGKGDYRRFRNYAVLYDLEGNALSYNTGGNSPQGFAVPAGFDGFIFMPFIGMYNFDGWFSFVGNPSTFPDFSSAYKLYLYFSDSSWNGCTVTVDDLAYFSSSADWSDSSQRAEMDADAWQTMRAFNYPVYKQPQPEDGMYSIPLDFEEGQIPFESVTSYYTLKNENGTSYPTLTGKSSITSAKALNGNVSLSMSAPANEGYTAESGYTYIRAESSKAKFYGIEGLEKATLGSTASNTYLKLRIKVPDSDRGYRIYLGFSQDGNDYTTVLRSAVYAYTKDGNYVAIGTDDLYTIIPAGFDGTLYFPFSNIMTYQTRNQGIRGTLENSIDFSQDFEMYFSLYGENWAMAEILLDDMEIAYGTEGDLNQDGKVNALDLLVLRQYLLGIESGITPADLNGDGAIDIRDLVSLKKTIAGIAVG